MVLALSDIFMYSLQYSYVIFFLAFKSEDYRHGPTQVLSTCIVFTHMDLRKISKRSPNIEFLQIKHIEL